MERREIQVTKGKEEKKPLTLKKKMIEKEMRRGRRKRSWNLRNKEEDMATEENITVEGENQSKFGIKKHNNRR